MAPLLLTQHKFLTVSCCVHRQRSVSRNSSPAVTLMGVPVLNTQVSDQLTPAVETVAQPMTEDISTKNAHS
jgi:hypothetical protein